MRFHFHLHNDESSHDQGNDQGKQIYFQSQVNVRNFIFGQGLRIQQNE